MEGLSKGKQNEMLSNSKREIINTNFHLVLPQMLLWAWYSQCLFSKEWDLLKQKFSVERSHSYNISPYGSVLNAACILCTLRDRKVFPKCFVSWDITHCWITASGMAYLNCFIVNASIVQFIHLLHSLYKFFETFIFKYNL